MGSSRLGDNLLGGLSPLIWVISIVTLLITLLVTTHEPPSRVLCLLRGCESSRLVGSQERRIPVGTWKPSNKKTIIPKVHRLESPKGPKATLQVDHEDLLPLSQVWLIDGLELSQLGFSLTASTSRVGCL